VLSGQVIVKMPFGPPDNYTTQWILAKSVVRISVELCVLVLCICAVGIALGVLSGVEKITYHSFSIMVAGIDGLGIKMSFGAEFMILAETRARRKGEGDERVGRESSSL